ncbi:hypothetical protein KY312_03595, partial [Candidatus Woesearchaeota archaeon]|nr:hypothetical protein [Candidatus Woesearchaeota archaeon]
EQEKQETDEMRLNYDYKKVLVLPADLMKKIWLSEKCYSDKKKHPGTKNWLSLFESMLESEIERMANKEFKFFYDDETGEPPDLDIVQIKTSYVEGLVEKKEDAWIRLKKYYPDTMRDDYYFCPANYIPGLDVSLMDKDADMTSQLVEKLLKNADKILRIEAKRRKLRREIEENLFQTTSTDDYLRLLEWKLPKNENL